MASPRKLVHVWVEGLYERDRDLGLAWAVKNDKDELVGTKLRYPYDMGGHENYGPDCAELVACYHAIKSLPPKSAIVVHTGSNGLIRWMELGREGFVLSQHQKWLSVPPFRKAFELALGESDKMISASFQYVRKNNEGMELVRELAQEALWPDEDA